MKQFRVWNPRIKAFHYWGFVLQENKEIVFVSAPHMDGVLTEHIQSSSDQFTGYYDIAGEPIFESDRILLDGKIEGVVVAFNGAWFVRSKGQFHTMLYFWVNYKTGTKIIGHIWQK